MKRSPPPATLATTQPRPPSAHQRPSKLHRSNRSQRSIRARRLRAIAIGVPTRMPHQQIDWNPFIERAMKCIAFSKASCARSIAEPLPPFGVGSGRPSGDSCHSRLAACANAPFARRVCLRATSGNAGDCRLRETAKPGHCAGHGFQSSSRSLMALYSHPISAILPAGTSRPAARSPPQCCHRASYVPGDVPHVQRKNRCRQ